jgi:hypothetical protein
LCEDKNKTVKAAPPPTGIDQTVPPTTDVGPCQAKRDEAADPARARVTAGTYCVCDEGDDLKQQHPGTLAAGRHLGKGHPVVIGSTLDDATNVVLGTTSLPFTSYAQGQELKTFASYDHDPVGNAPDPGNITHLVKITPFQVKPDERLPGDCPADGNIISIDFCYLREVTTNGTTQTEWACPEDAASAGQHFGDIHASN